MTQHFTVNRKRGRRAQASLPFALEYVPGQASKGVRGVKETEIQRGVLRALELHPKVAWCRRLNVGAGRLANEDGTAGRFMRFAFKGCSDIIGQLKSGVVLAVEVKAAGGRLREEQAAFLALINKHGGVAFVACSVDDVMRYLSDE